MFQPFIGTPTPFLATAGMMVSPESILPEFGDGPKEAKGSMLIVEAENIEEVRKMIEADVYYTSGVVCRATCRIHEYESNLGIPQWDTEKLAIFPIFLATK